MAVIEYISVLTLLGLGQRPLILVNARTGDETSQTYIPSTFQLTEINYDWWVASQQVRLYADSGATIAVQVSRDQTAVPAIAYISISGYLVDMP
jgi:hypothetical protein